MSRFCGRSKKIKNPMMTSYLLLLGAVTCPAAVWAQNNYVHGVELSVDGITYDVTHTPGVIALSNAANELLDQPIVRLDGTELTEAEYEDLSVGELEAGTLQQALLQTFTQEEYKALVQGKDVMRLLLVQRSDGCIAEVAFFIRDSPRTAALPPEKYALLERNIKSYVRYSLTAEEKQLKFVRMEIILNFAKMRLFYLKPGGGTPIGPDVELKE